MYANLSLRMPISTRLAFFLLTLAVVGLSVNSASLAVAQSHVITNITQSSERLELTVNTSRILTLEKRIPKMVVNNPELVTVTALSANQIQLAARKPGVTQVNLWDEAGEVYTVDVLIYGDVRELEMALKKSFPESSIRVMRLTNSLVLEGFVERPEAVSPIIRLAEDYAPKVINNITVGGVQQIMLKVKVMEVSRTKLRRLGIDWEQASGLSSVVSRVSGIGPGDGTFELGIVQAGNTFDLFVDALEQNNLAKIMADPTIVAISGRPATFNVGGELPIIVPSGLGQTTIEYKKFGTQIDFVPIVLGNGNIRLEVRPRISELDDTRSIQINQFTIPALKVREVDTAVEMKAGQTLVLAGLVQTRIDAIKRSVPVLGHLPYIGAAFRSVEEDVNEIELLIMVTPEFVAGLDPHEVPQCGPGMETVSPSNGELYLGAHLEVAASGPCGPGNYGACGKIGCQSCNPSAIATDADMSTNSNTPQVSDESAEGSLVPVEPTNPPLRLSPEESDPTTYSTGRPTAEPSTGRDRLAKVDAYRSLPSQPAPWLQTASRRPKNPTTRQYQMARRPQSQPTTSTPGLIGPLGYDVGK